MDLKAKTLMIHEFGDNLNLITGDELAALKIDDLYLPFLSETALLEKFPSVTVDSGAIKFVCDGANIMRPGIKKYSGFENEQIVCVKEESHNKFLAVGKALVPSSEMEKMTKGEIVKNLHYISDKFWEAAKVIKK